MPRPRRLFIVAGTSLHGVDGCGREERRDLCCSLELGGKSAAIILPDADLAATIEGLRYGALFSSGQSCVLMSRILVPRSRHDASSPR